MNSTPSLGSDLSPEDIEPSWVSGGRFRFPVIPKTSPWEGCFKSVHRHDKEMCERWQDEVDKLLIFAGLFSAAVTAFAVEGYKMLQPDLAMTLGAIITVGNPARSTSPEFTPQPSAVRINIFWFLSLVLGLTTVFVGILSMQWLREYQRYEATTAADEALGLRQMRYQGLLTWRVPEIIGALPLLLQTAVFLFFCGLLDFLWSLHRVVAIVVTIPVVILATFLIITTVLPAMQYTFTRHLNLRIPQCAYKSPQSWIFHRILLFFSILLIRMTEVLNVKSLFRFEVRERRSLMLRLFAASDWRMYDKCWRQQRDLEFNRTLNGGFVGRTVVREDVAQGLSWIINSFSPDLDFITLIYRCFQLMGDGEKKVMLLSCRRFTPLADDFSNRLGGDGAPAIGDYLSSRALDYLLSGIGYESDGTWDLLQHRIELYIRVTRASIKFQQRPMLYCPLSYYSRFSDEVQIQLLNIATTLLSQSHRGPDFVVAVIILHQTSSHPAIRIPISHTDAEEHPGPGSIEAVGSWRELRRHFASALVNASGSLLHREEILKHQPVRFRFYRWFLSIILSTSTSRSNPLLGITLPTLKAVAPAIQSIISSSATVDTEYPTHPVFKPAWNLLLEEKYSELASFVTRQSNTGPEDEPPIT